MDKLSASFTFKVFFIIASYLLGSVCFGYVFARALKKNDFGKKDLPEGAGSARQMVLQQVQQ